MPRRARRVMRVVGPLMGIVWAVFLLQPWQAAWATEPGVERTVSLAAVAAVALSFAVVVVARARPWSRPVPLRTALLVLSGQVLLVGLSCLAARQDGLVGLVFVCVSAIFLLRDPRALLVSVGSMVTLFVVPRVVPTWDTIDSLAVSVVLASVAVFGFTQLVERNRQLQAAQEEVAALAVEQERERIARDVHDILGHTLTVVSVKAELAGRLVGADPARARDEIAQVQALARAALSDVRGMVRGTRAVTLAAELAGAREAFDAAGIEAEVPGTAEVVPERLRPLFAWAVREATTNVLRHAAATRVRIVLAADRLVVDDDGRGPGGASGTGNGLRGLRARADELGGRVEAGPSPLGGYRLTVLAAEDEA